MDKGISIYLRKKFIIYYIIIKEVPDHLSDLGDLDDSIFLSESKCYSIFLHLFHYFHLNLYNTNHIISTNKYKDNRFSLSGKRQSLPMINFVLDFSTYVYHQKDSKQVYLASEQLKCEQLNG